MNIWIFNHHALTPDMSGGTRHYDFAKELVNRGHSVTIIASSFHYSKFQEMKEYHEKEYLLETIDGIDFIWIKTSKYFNNGINRVKNMLSYVYKALKFIPDLKLLKPDIIIGSSVHLFAVWVAYRFSLKYKTPFIMEVRDLWPQTFIDMGISKWHPFVIILAWLEKYLYKKANKIISNLPFAYEYINRFVSKDKFIWISNGVNLSNISYVPKQQGEKFIISYTGSLGKLDNLELLLDVAKILRNNNNIYFRIVGDGPEKLKLIDIIKRNNILNVSIENQVPKNQVFDILKESDVLFLSLKNSPLYKYGISLNKIFDYMASGRVIIFSANAKNNPIADANAGFTIKPNDINELKNVILKIYNLSQDERNKIGKKIREHVEENYSIEILVNNLEKLLQQEIKKYNA